MFDAKEKFFELFVPAESKKDKDDKRVGWWWPIVVLAGGSLLYYLIYLNDDILPDFVPIEEATTNPLTFCGECSREFTRRFTALGPRLVGTPQNEIESPRILMNELEKIKREASSNQDVNIELQKGSGGYPLEYEPPFINIYDNIQNVIALLKGSEGSHSILVNCHYDSMVTSPGAADDMISCSAMMEILRVLSKHSTRLKHNVVFLFNGAEETSLQASHLFMQHSSSKKCRVIINLEAVGLGGKNALFQSGPNHPWLVEYYAKNAPYPHGQILGEELFQSGVLPSDSDFRVFRDFGNMSGFDFAFWRNGYVYHTTRDSERFMPIGCHQQLGENTLNLLKALGNAPELDDMKAHEEGEMVYYDYLGWFLIYYTKTASIILNSFVIVFAICSIALFVVRTKLEQDMEYWTVLMELGIAVLATVLAFGFSLGMPVILSLIIDAAGPYAMAWYSNPMLLVPFYWQPTVASYLLILCLVEMWRKTKRDMSVTTVCQMYLIANQVPWIIIMIILLSLNIRSSALLFLTMSFSALANLVIHGTPLYRKGYYWIIAYMVINLPALMYTMYIVQLAFMFFLPIFARSGSGNSDLSISMISAILIYYIMSFAMPLILLVRKPGIIIGLMAFVSFIVIIVTLSTDLGYPYSEMKPQRHWIMHINRQFRNEFSNIRREENGFIIYNQDDNSIRNLPLDKNDLKTMEDDCATELFCGLPLYTTRQIKSSKTTNWLFVGEPVLPNPTEIQLKKKSCDSNQTSCDLTIILRGPDRMTLMISPREQVSIHSWSLPSAILATGEYHGRPSYLIHIVRTELSDKEINLKFKVSAAQLSGSPIVDISLVGNFIHHEGYLTDEYRKFLRNMPDRSNVYAWISAYRGYVF